MGMKGKRSRDKWINTLIRYVFRAGRLTWHEGYIKVFVCSDYEFLSKMYGISGASGM